MSAKLIKITCPRCTGSGRHSFNLRDGDVCYGCSGSGFKMVNPTTDARKAAKAAEKEAYHTAVSEYHDALIERYRADARLPEKAIPDGLLDWAIMLAKKDGAYAKPSPMTAAERKTALLIKRPGKALEIEGWSL